LKTKNEILTDVISVINSTPILALNGDIYKKIRKTDSKLEDCVLNVIPGVIGKFIQDGALYVKIFYNDISIDNSFYENTLRSQYMETLLYDLSESLLKNNTYSFDVMSRDISTESVEEIHQHFAILKINFKLLK
jgi:hypothetical protein